MNTLLHLIGPTESRTDFAMRIYDTAEPPVSVYRAAKLAGISPTTLTQRLATRERCERARCPQCGRYPGERDWTVKPGPRTRSFVPPRSVDAVDERETPPRRRGT